MAGERSSPCSDPMLASISADVRFRAAISAAAAPAPTPQLHSSKCSLAAVLAAKVIAIVLPAVRTFGAPSTAIARNGKLNGFACPACQQRYRCHLEKNAAQMPAGLCRLLTRESLIFSLRTSMRRIWLTVAHASLGQEQGESRRGLSGKGSPVSSSKPAGFSTPRIGRQKQGGHSTDD